MKWRLHTYRAGDDDFRWFAHLHNGDAKVADLSVEASTNRKHKFAHAEVTLNGEDDVQFALALPYLFSVWLSASVGALGFSWQSRNPLRRLFVRGKPEHAGGEGIAPGPLGYGERETGVSVIHGALHLRLMGDPNGDWSRREGRAKLQPDTGWEWRIPIDPRGLLGAHEYSRQNLSRHGDTLPEGTMADVVEADVPMPEGVYRAAISLHRDSWTRKRRRKPSRVVYRAEVVMQTPIPEPGKGENSWDIDDDALWESTLPARSVAEAVAGVVESALTTRERRQGLAWTPDAGWPEGVAR